MRIKIFSRAHKVIRKVYDLQKWSLFCFFFRKKNFSSAERKSFICIKIASKIAWNQKWFNLSETECFKQKIWVQLSCCVLQTFFVHVQTHQKAVPLVDPTLIFFLNVFIDFELHAQSSIFRQHLAKLMQNVDLRFLNVRDNFN